MMAEPCNEHFNFNEAPNHRLCRRLLEQGGLARERHMLHPDGMEFLRKVLRRVLASKSYPTVNLTLSFRVTKHAWMSESAELA